MSQTIRQYTVLLAYPNEVNQTYLGWTMATSVKNAIATCRDECNAENDLNLDDVKALEVIAVFKGHRSDIKELD